MKRMSAQGNCYCYLILYSMKLIILMAVIILTALVNTAAWLIFSSSKFQHITPCLRELHWLKASEQIMFKYAVIVYKCLHGSAPAYLTDELCQVADVEARRQLHSSSSSSLIVSRPDCLLSVTELFRSLLLASARSCHFHTFRSCLPVSAQNPLV